jgi:3'-phosphoadenosine 5'-phosphosulfate sulfotransferase (PAPS reductase)/FAD synthetase
MKHIVAYSGGKDSTALAFRLRDLMPDENFTYVITPTGDELPDVEKHWETMRDRLGGEWLSLRNETLTELIVKKRMIPNFRYRYCTVMLKIEPFLEFLTENVPTGATIYVGLRADENGRFGLHAPDHSYTVRYPLREWGWDLNSVLEYLKFKNVTIPDRTDCGCCPLQRLGEWRNLWLKYPERYDRYVQLEKSIGHTFRSDGRDMWPASLDELRTQFELGRIPRRYMNRIEKRCRFCTM